MTEHFTLEQSMRNTSQIHFHKRFLATGTVQMYRFGYQLLTCTTFTGNQDRCVGTRYPLDRGQHIHQCLTLSNDMTTVEAVIIFHRNRCFLIL